MMTLIQILYLDPPGVGLILCAVSAVYFLVGQHQPTGKRIMKSSHGVVFMCAMMLPFVARSLSLSSYAEWLGYTFAIFVLLGFAATVYSLYDYARHWYLHLLHVFTVLYGALAVIYGMNALPH
jgi:hypothetical protein